MTAKLGEGHRFTVIERADVRLDIWLVDQIRMSRAQLKRLIDDGSVLVNGIPAKAGYRVQQGDEISVFPFKIQVPLLEPEPIPLEIIYEDQDVAVINKPKDLVVHPGAGHMEGTLVNALLYHVDELATGGDSQRPGIVHRLDKDTSGLMMIAKTEESYRCLTAQLKERLVERHYLALVHGVFKVTEGEIDEPIGRHLKNRKKMAIVASGREAQTHFTVQESFQKHSLVSCRLVTGRTHQIRVHMASIHHPLVGDALYGIKHNNLGAKSQVLHAAYLSFRHPSGQYLEFRSDPEPEFWDIVEKARRIN